MGPSGAASSRDTLVNQEEEYQPLLGKTSIRSPKSLGSAAMSTKAWEKDDIAIHSLPAVSDVGSSERVSDGDLKANAPWWSYIWDYEPGRSKEERAFVQRLDISVLIILSLGYFIKNLDQTNIANAYVSGMREDLAMNSNQINIIDVAWTCGYGT